MLLHQFSIDVHIYPNALLNNFIHFIYFILYILYYLFIVFIYLNLIYFILFMETLKHVFIFVFNVKVISLPFHLHFLINK